VVAVAAAAVRSSRGRVALRLAARRTQRRRPTRSLEGDDGMSVERRQDARRTINHDFASVDEFIAEYVTNISRSGVFIKSDDPLPIGTRVNLRFTVILEELETIEGLGEVVRNVPPSADSPGGMGVVFVELGQVSRDLIERILVRR
jgi:uncharacterized protein (TIGR02266 family)